uniref:Pectate lyase domain-containing protein n=1 Tax=Fagus sylvatica TaxID=28930 RepID=A0A2N9I445_FAGSY
MPQKQALTLMVLTYPSRLMFKFMIVSLEQVTIGDDCIAIGRGSSYINITGVQCGPGHGISIGSLGAQGRTDTVEEVHVQGCSFRGTTNGARIKTWQGGSGYARRISFEDITLDAVDNPIIIDQYYCINNENGCKIKTSAVQVSDVLYNGVHGTSITEEAVKINCSQSIACTNLVFNDINITSAYPGETTRSVIFNAEGTSAPSVPALNYLSPPKPRRV